MVCAVSSMSSSALQVFTSAVMIARPVSARTPAPSVARCAHDVALADDAVDVAPSVADHDGTDVVLGQQVDELGDGGGGGDGHHVGALLAGSRPRSSCANVPGRRGSRRQSTRRYGRLSGEGSAPTTRADGPPHDPDRAGRHQHRPDPRGGRARRSTSRRPTPSTRSTSRGQYDYSRAGNPTRQRAGRAARRLEGGAGGVVTAQRHGGDHHLLPALAARRRHAGRPATTATAAPGGCSTRSPAPDASSCALADFSDADAAAAAIAERRRPGLGRDPVQSAAAHHRPRRAVAAPPTPPVRSWWPTTPSRRRWCSVRSSRRGRRGAFDHQVPQRALRRGGRRDRRRATPTAPSRARLVGEHPRRRPAARWTPTSPCAVCAPCTCGWPRPSATRPRWSTLLPAIRRSRRALPGAGRPPGTTTWPPGSRTGSAPSSPSRLAGGRAVPALAGRAELLLPRRDPGRRRVAGVATRRR